MLSIAPRFLRLARIPVALCALLFAPAAASAQPTFSASFETNSIGPGSATLLRFVIDNSGSGTPASNLGFTATLPAGVTLTSPSGASSGCTDAQLDAPAGGTTVTLTDVRLGGFASCTVSAYVTSATPGVHVLVTGDLTSSAGNSGTASAMLTVLSTRPGLTLAASPASVPWQGRTTLTYTFDNSANGAAVSAGTLTHTLPAGLTVADPPLVTSTCPGVTTAVAGGQSISFMGTPAFPTPAIPAGGSCTLSVDVRVGVVGPVALVTQPATSSVMFSQDAIGRAVGLVTGTTDLALLKVDFLADPVAPGDTLTLAYTLYNRDRNGAQTGLAFTHDLGATLSGLTATSVSANGCGGAVTTGATVSVSAVTLDSGAECRIDVSVSVPAGAAAGVYPSLTSVLRADPGASVVGPAGSDIMDVLAGPRLSLMLSPDPVGSGGTLTAEFTVENVSTTDALTDIAVSAPLTTLLPGATWTAPGADACGAGSSASFTGGFDPAFTVSGASLPAGGSCTFSFTATVPGDTPSGVQRIATTTPTATLGGQPVSGASASASVAILAPPHLSLGLAQGTLAPGESTTLSITLTSNENAAMTTGLAFDLLEVPGLPGAVYGALPAAGFCGAGSSASVGTSPALVAFTGLSLGVNASCTFDVTVTAPAGAASGDYTLATSDLTAMVGGLAASANARSAALTVAVLRPSLEVVDDPALPGDTVTLRFSFENASATGAIAGLTSTVNLGAALAGLVAVGLPVNDVCGPGSQLSGTSTLILTGGSLAATGSCSFDVTLQVPAAAADGQYGILTSAFSYTLDASPVTSRAVSAELLVGSPLMLALELPGSPARAGGTTVLNVTLANAAASAATGLAFTLDLGAAYPGLVVSTLPSAGECGGASVSGTGVLDVSGGSLGAGASCSFQVTLTLPDAPGPQGGATLVTSALTGTVNGLAAGASPASATLQVHAVDLSLPAETTLEAGGSAELTLTVTNFTGAMLGEGSFTLPLSALPSGVTVTDVAFDAGCMGAVSVSGTSTLAFRASGFDAGQSCTITLTLTALSNTAAGDVLLTTSAVTDGGADIGAAASGTLHILRASVPSFGLAVTPTTTTPGGTATVTFIVTNAGSTLALSGLGFTLELPSGVGFVSGTTPTNDCGGTLDASGATVTFTDGTLAAMTSCTITVDVSASTIGEYTLTPSDLATSRGPLPAPTATLTVVSTLVDAGVNPDGSVPPDGSVGRDGGMGLGGGGGCGCRVAATAARGGLGWVALGLLGAVLARRRRRAR